MKRVKAEQRKGNTIALIIEVESTLQEAIILTQEEGMRLANEIPKALLDTPIRS